MEGVLGTQKLTLKCPRQGRSRGYTALSASQLLAARDYLSIIMPYSSRIVPKQPPRFNVQLLIVAPADCTVDVISVVVCYLAFSSGYHAETVMQYIGEEKYDEVWKEAMSQEGLDFVERIARDIVASTKTLSKGLTQIDMDLDFLNDIPDPARSLVKDTNMMYPDASAKMSATLQIFRVTKICSWGMLVGHK
ncbi:uncharacterized protein BJ212DRAFT_1299003 [Suillus subaureus]|uniref:Uncharacterized protein n=1 Tax=Suillus subaureus TaxID=48587 RepID=A0A9P7EDJ0_9AGAM|nr:uncharacterized protein BJ212DRAFT_1299003 [Suillus subaureus]KAG1818173.1 hypothetical protein BJ212DRAFT_1299003 [Suillus subaureus]